MAALFPCGHTPDADSSACTLVGQIRDGRPRLVLAVWEQVLLLPRGVGYVGQHDVLLGRLA